MKISLFGKTLFESKRNQMDQLMSMVEKSSDESKYLPDFHQRRGFDQFNTWSIPEPTPYIMFSNGTGISGVPAKVKKNKKAAKKEKPKVTPKGVYELKLLNDQAFKLNTDEKYVDGQIESFKEKLTLIKSEEYDMRNGVDEISSILVRMENRKKYAEHKTFFEEFPYTTSSKIEALLKDTKHDNLQVGEIAQFIADLPREATDVMKRYNTETNKLCGKQAVFYIIADKKDFKKANSRRDPILLAQSPFGHVWQILGAWDDEMLFIEEL